MNGKCPKCGAKQTTDTEFECGSYYYTPMPLGQIPEPSKFIESVQCLRNQLAAKKDLQETGNVLELATKKGSNAMSKYFTKGLVQGIFEGLIVGLLVLLVSSFFFNRIQN